MPTPLFKVKILRSLHIEETRDYLYRTRTKANLNLKPIGSTCVPTIEVDIREIGHEELLRSTREKSGYGSSITN